MGRYLRGSQATHRATLWFVIDALGTDAASYSRRPIARSNPTRPYSETEIAALHSWARAQGTDRRRLDAMALLALGLGAGLATRELLGVRVSNLHHVGKRTFVTVWESRPRVVPMRPEWERPLERIRDELSPNDWLFRPGRLGPASGQITDFLQRARTRLDVRPARMRTTWLVNHLTDGTPPNVLLRISGLKNLAALDKLTDFVPKTGHAAHVD
jgi:integrase